MLDESDQASMAAMINLWQQKSVRNRERQLYYDSKVMLRDLGIAIPPQLKNLDTVVGWPAKSVDVLADRITFQNFVTPDDASDPLGLNSLLRDNHFDLEFDQAVSGSLIHSCSFIVVTKGLEDEPDIIINSKSALEATGLWDSRRRVLKCGLSVTDFTDDGNASQYVAYFPDKVATFTKTSRGWSVDVQRNDVGRVLMVPVPFKPSYSRPFGRSRISRPVMRFTDAAIRTAVRAEVAAEFFTTPQRYGMGMAEEAFEVDKWKAVTGRMLMASRDEDGNIPNVGQFPQMSMQPLTDQLRMWASQLSGESSIPLDELGFQSSNPTSDAAIQSQRDPLRLIADHAERVYDVSLRQVAALAVMLRDAKTQMPDELTNLQVHWKPTFTMSDAAAADFASKVVQAVPWIADSPVLLEKLNFDAETITRLMSDKRKGEASATLNQLLGVAHDNATGRDTSQPGSTASSQDGTTGDVPTLPINSADEPSMAA